MSNCVSPFPDSHRIRIRKIGSLCCRSNKATDCSQPTKWMPSILNWTALEETVDYQCYSLFWGAAGKKKKHIWSLCRLYRGKYFDGARELWIPDKQTHMSASVQWNPIPPRWGTHMASEPRRCECEHQAHGSGAQELSEEREQRMRKGLICCCVCQFLRIVATHENCRVKVQKGSTGNLLCSIITC